MNTGVCSELGSTSDQRRCHGCLMFYWSQTTFSVLFYFIFFLTEPRMLVENLLQRFQAGKEWEGGSLTEELMLLMWHIWQPPYPHPPEKKIEMKMGKIPPRSWTCTTCYCYDSRWFLHRHFWSRKQVYQKKQWGKKEVTDSGVLLLCEEKKGRVITAGARDDSIPGWWQTSFLPRKGPSR